MAINLADSYEKAFEHTRRQLMTQPKGKQFDFNKDKIFEKFNIFKRRLEKLVDMFKTIHQFSSLEQHTHIEGLSDMIANFNTITDNVRMKVSIACLATILSGLYLCLQCLTERSCAGPGSSGLFQHTV